MPLPRPQTVDRLLRSYLAFVASRSGHGNRHLLFQLVHTTYLSFFLWREGYGAADRRLYSIAEKVLDDAAGAGYMSGVWLIRPEDEAAIRQVLRVYDLQLQSVPVGSLRDAETKLARLFERLEGSGAAGHQPA